MKTNVTTMAVISRRMSQDQQSNETKLLELQTVKIYLEDKIDGQSSKIESLTTVSDEQVFKLNCQTSEIKELLAKTGKLTNTVKEIKEELTDKVQYALAKDARIKVISKAVHDLKSSLEWGHFNGSTKELDRLFEPVFQLF